MPRRSFRTAAGVEWQVWSVIPGQVQGDERRHGYDRRSPDPVILYMGPDRRTSGERRKQKHSPAFPANGWLVFDSPQERRRLFPIPPAWETRPEGDLERLCERAVPVPKSN
jgi:hypothetical protein